MERLSLDGGFNANGDRIFFGANGVGQEKISIRRYDALLGFGVDTSRYVRPYAGVLFTRIDGSDEVSFRGTGSVCIIPNGGSSCTSQSVSQSQFSVKRDIEQANSLGGVVGIILNPGEEIGMTLDGQFGVSETISASAFMRF